MAAFPANGSAEPGNPEPLNPEPRTPYLIWHFKHNRLRQLFITSMDFSFENAL
jgi:hypothetical protein